MRRQKRQLVQWREPEPVALTHRRCVAFSELGADGPVDDYSCQDAASGARAIQYTDYRLAHTTTKLVDDEDFEAVKVARNGLRSVDAMLKHRAALSHVMSDEDAQAQEDEARARRRAEARRVAALGELDRRMEQAHERASRLLR